MTIQDQPRAARLTSLAEAPITGRTKVNRWECDHNDHWNARFYVRSFQEAAEAFAGLAGSKNPGAASTRLRHMRFHHELFLGAPVTVRSALVAGGAHHGALVHVLSSSGRISATALDRPACLPASPPWLAAEAVMMALPRGLDPGPDRPDRAADLREAPNCEMGPIRPHECDHTGALMMFELVGRAAVGSHRVMNEAGFTPDFIRATSIGRMALEMKVTPHAAAHAGTALVAWSRVSSVVEKGFALRHDVRRVGTGDAVATIEQRIVAVDLAARRAVRLPEVLRRRLDALAGRDVPT